MLGADAYLWIKALHVIAVIAWMAGLFYLPRLYVYHSKEPAGSATSETFKIMECRLANAIMTPAMVASLIFGALLLWDIWSLSIWLIAKLLAVAGLIWFHFALLRYLRAFARDERPGSERYFRLINEVPTVLVIVVIFAVIVKPFA